ncbi:MAG: hypothetical protein RLY70_3647 [Planctomycetota bacterium]|jgi:hypothetical protein
MTVFYAAEARSTALAPIPFFEAIASPPAGPSPDFGWRLSEATEE